MKAVNKNWIFSDDNLEAVGKISEGRKEDNQQTLKQLSLFIRGSRTVVIAVTTHTTKPPPPQFPAVSTDFIHQRIYLKNSSGRLRLKYLSAPEVAHPQYVPPVLGRAQTAVTFDQTRTIFYPLASRIFAVEGPLVASVSWLPPKSCYLRTIITLIGQGLRGSSFRLVCFLSVSGTRREHVSLGFSCTWSHFYRPPSRRSRPGKTYQRQTEVYPRTRTPVDYLENKSHEKIIFHTFQENIQFFFKYVSGEYSVLYTYLKKYSFFAATKFIFCDRRGRQEGLYNISSVR